MSFGLENSAMRMFDVGPDTGADCNLVCSEVLQISSTNNLSPLAHRSRLGDTNGRQIQLVVMVVIHLLI